MCQELGIKRKISKSCANIFILNVPKWNRALRIFLISLAIVLSCLGPDGLAKFQSPKVSKCMPCKCIGDRKHNRITRGWTNFAVMDSNWSKWMEIPVGGGKVYWIPSNCVHLGRGIGRGRGTGGNLKQDFLITLILHKQIMKSQYFRAFTTCYACCLAHSLRKSLRATQKEDGKWHFCEWKAVPSLSSLSMQLCPMIGFTRGKNLVSNGTTKWVEANEIWPSQCWEGVVEFRGFSSP